MCFYIKVFINIFIFWFSKSMSCSSNAGDIKTSFALPALKRTDAVRSLPVPDMDTKVGLALVLQIPRVAT